jgi:hypothetical protein
MEDEEEGGREEVEDGASDRELLVEVHGGSGQNPVGAQMPRP